MPESLEHHLREDAAAYGFDAFGICRPDAVADAAAGLAGYLEAGYHGDMSWLAATAERRSNPVRLWPDCRSAILLGLSYAPGHDPLIRLGETDRGLIAAYAKGRDYHDLIKGRLKQVAGRFAARAGCNVKVFVDTAPLMEKPLAAAAGLGWQGKHTNLVSRQHGSWLLLGAILTDADLTPTAPEADLCGTCRRCLDICPTDAFPAPYHLDARRCIAYLTIEYAGHIPAEFRPAIANRVFGCDDCLAVCPWNKFAERARETKLHARSETDDPPLSELVHLDDKAFRKRFAGTPIKRTGRDRIVRNVLIAIANAADTSLVGPVMDRLCDHAAIVRAMAVWAAGTLLPRTDRVKLAERHLPSETDPDVRREWTSISASRDLLQ